MGIKEEVRQAQQKALELQSAGMTPQEIATALNIEFDGFYYVGNGIVYRQNVPDYAPGVRVLA